MRSIEIAQNAFIKGELRQIAPGFSKKIAEQI
jgi:hypothetical protein